MKLYDINVLDKDFNEGFPRAVQASHELMKNHDPERRFEICPVCATVTEQGKRGIYFRHCGPCGEDVAMAYAFKELKDHPGYEDTMNARLAFVHGWKDNTDRSRLVWEWINKLQTEEGELVGQSIANPHLKTERVDAGSTEAQEKEGQEEGGDS